LKKEIASIDRQMASLIGRISAFRQKAALLRTAPGIGPVAAATLLARLPDSVILIERRLPPWLV
jgi:transposase